MANGDYGYFGKGDTGYAQYMAWPSTATLVARPAVAAWIQWRAVVGGDGSGCGVPLIAIAGGGGRAGALIAMRS